ncbi:MAG: chemotaxis-specific protein-glutamate methyltransferase CheB [bacterium]
MIRVLIVDDSPTAQQLLNRLLSQDPAIEVIGIAKDGKEALAKVAADRPDVVTMDVVMPGIDGIETTRTLMENMPLPIIVVSSVLNQKEVNLTFQALAAGALGVVDKPTSSSPGSDSGRRLLHIVKAMAEVKVVRRRPISSRPSDSAAVPSLLMGTDLKSVPIRREGFRGVAMGASTGGPPILVRILSELPGDFPLPILIVQHISPGFIQGMVDWLKDSIHLSVELAQQAAPLLPGHVYLAPDDWQFGLDAADRVTLSKDPPENDLRPSVSFLFRSVSKRWGAQSIGVLLSGMGSDGARELGAIRRQGGVTIAQNEESSAVFGMPGAAVTLGAVDFLLGPEQIVTTLESLAYQSMSER